MKGLWILTLLVVLPVHVASAAEPAITHVDVFKSGTEGYHTFRIPAIETAPDGSLIALAEARKYSQEDPGFGKQDIDLVCKRSTDDGRTWSAMKLIEDPGELWSAANPATVVDRQNGRVWLLYLRSRPGRSTLTSRPGTDDMQTLARWSDDNGATWSEPIELTAVARDLENKENWRASVVGPGGAICTSKGRLVAPVWKTVPFGVFTVYSDDHGRTWQRGEMVPGQDLGDENQLVELADGRILVDVRQQNGPHRWLATSSDGGQTWSEPRPGAAVTPVACAIERYTLKSAGDDRDRILWTGPKGPGRANLVVRLSYDEGQTFSDERLIAAAPASGYPAAYSDLTVLKDKTVGVLWERGVEQGYQFITFSRFNREFLEKQGPAEAKPSPNIVLENDYVRYTLGADGRNLSFFDKRTGTERSVREGSRPFLTLKKGNQQHSPTACAYADGTISVKFQQPDVTALVKVTCKPRYFVFEVASVSDPAVEELVLVNLAVTPSQHVSGMSGVASDDEFAVCLRALDLRTLPSIGGSPVTFSARYDRQYGIVGAKLALVGCPQGEIRSVLKEMIRAEGLPYSPLGGPFALDAPETRGSYVFADVSQQNVTQWIDLVKKAGIAQIHFIGWERSLGHYQPRADLFPDGLAGLKATVEKIHAAGLKAGLHTLTGCIAPNDSWVTPVPDKRLAADATFALAAPLDDKQTTVLTSEQPGEFDTVWAYGGRGNVLRIDEELIQFSGLARRPPYGFTNCRRGAFGTKPALHEKGAQVSYLFVRYGCFQPDEDSTLVDDVAAAIAEVFNTCGFDMIYMDGAEGMAGGWHGEARMRQAIFAKLKRPALVEASSWGYHSWPFHSRIGAWDYPNWGLKPFIDVHCRANEAYRQTTLLPGQLGWWAIFGPDRNRDTELPDEIEYLCTKALAYDTPTSFQAVQPGGRPENARQDEYLTLIGQYERLRLARHFPEAVKQRLRREREEFCLVQTTDGTWQFVPTDYAVHRITALDDGSQNWTVNNRFAGQPVKLRIQALYSAAPYDAKQGLVLADFRSEDEFAVRAAARDVIHALKPSDEQVKAGGDQRDQSFASVPVGARGRYSATNAGSSRRGAWARVGKSFTPDADVDKYDALGVWVHGDGKGELLNLQLASPPQYYHALDEHYVKVDFQGWRYFELLLRERDADRYGDYVWPYEGQYAVYRAPLVRTHVSELNLYYNNLPPQESVTCLLSPIKALEVQKVTLRNPSVQIGDRRVVFPVALESGAYLEFTPPSDCRLYDARGALVRRFQPEGEAPVLGTGENRVNFRCEGPEGFRSRAKLTVISCGEPFGGER